MNFVDSLLYNHRTHLKSDVIWSGKYATTFENQEKGWIEFFCHKIT